MKTKIMKGTCVRNKAAFTLAEMTVVMFIFCILMVVMAPVITTRHKSSNASATSPWKYASNNQSDTYFGTHNNQKVLIGQKTADDDENVRLIINTSSDDQNHILFKNGNSTLGVLNMNSGIAVGNNVTANSGGVAIGYGASATADGAVAIGKNANSDTQNTIVLGDTDSKTHVKGDLVVDGTVTFSSCGSTASNSKFKLGDKSVYCSSMDSYLQYGTTSDRRLKNVGVEVTSGLDKIKQLKVFNYTFKNDAAKTPRVGVMAQDLQKVFPNAVTKGKDGYLLIRQEDMFYAMVNSIKELDKKISDLFTTESKKDKKIKELEKRIELLEKKLK